MTQAETANTTTPADTRVVAGFTRLEGPICELQLRQRAIMMISEDHLALAGPVTLPEDLAEVLVFLLNEQRAAIEALVSGFYEAHNTYAASTFRH